MGNKSKKSVRDIEINTDRVEKVKDDAEMSSKNTANEATTSETLTSISQDESNDVGALQSDSVAENSNAPANATSALENADNAVESDEPVIIIGGASEVVFEAEPTDDDDYDEEEPVENEEQKSNEKSLRIIEGGGKEIIIDDSCGGKEKHSDAPQCKRNKIKDKKIGDYGTYTAIAFFIITIIISLFNIKGMRYPLSCLFLSLAALSMGVTTVLRLLNNKKCNCSTCKTQNKTFMYSAILWFAVFVGALIAFLVLFLK